VFPNDTELAGDHTIEVILTAKYTNERILPFLVDKLGLLSEDKVILTESFDIKITVLPTGDISAPQEGPSFDAELAD
jgi:hypothetical protein